jgi:protein-arginine kinase activator protein McsA
MITMEPGDKCPSCHRTLIEIDHYGERLVGCIECNRWS